MQTLATKPLETLSARKKERQVQPVQVSPWHIQPVAPIDEPIVQRKVACACGGGCPNCSEDLPERVVQTKLAVSLPGDELENEADRIAEEVLRVPPPALRNPTQRQTNTPKEEGIKIQTKANSSPTSGRQAIPAAVHDVLGRPGQPLDPTVRLSMETSFGHDFRHLRVHTDSLAAESARAVSARAYTVGHNIVFGSGEYAPHSEAGRLLLAHELVHAIQQGGRHALLQRQCVKTACPPAPVVINALFPIYEAAEKCIQEMYAGSHSASKRGVSLSFNADWLHLTGGTPNEKKALNCARGLETPGAGPNVTGKSGMFAAAPDIWDLRNTTMYEITTPSGMTFRVGKLGAEILNANRICGTAECGGLHFDRGTWAPPEGCYSLGGDLYFNAMNNQGVIVYNMMKDATKELVLATLLALMAAGMKNAGPKTALAAAPKALGKALPVYAIASLAAIVVLVASGRAEAKPGPGGEEPLVALFKAMEAKGTPVPKEIQEMLDANPDLKEKMNKAMAEGGDPTKLQEEMNKRILDTIAANKDQFTKEELEVLLASTQVAGKTLPKGDMTVQELKKLAETAKSGKTDGDGSGTGTASVPGKDVPSEPPKQDPQPTKGEVPTKGGGDQGAALPISQTSRESIAKAPAPVRDLFNSLLGSGPNSKKLTDADVQQFLGLVPASLTSDQLAKLQARMLEATGQNVEQIFVSLKTALSEIDKAAGQGDAAAKDPKRDKPADADSASLDPAAKPPETATVTVDPKASPPKTDPQKLIEELSAKAKKSSFGDLATGSYGVTWTPEKKGVPEVGYRITGSLRGKLSDGKTTYVGRVIAEVTAVKDKNLKIKFITATPMVASDGKIVFAADHFVGREDSVVLDPPKKEKNK